MNALTVSCITFFTFSCNYAVLRYLLMPKTCAITCDWFIAPTVKAQLEQQALPKSSRHTSDYVQIALQNLPVLQTVSTQLQGYKHLHVTAHARLPWLRVNNQYILTRDGFLIPASFFNNDLTASLMNITADAQNIRHFVYNKELFEFLNNLPRELLLDAAITWHNKTDIHLQIPQLPDITIISHHLNKFDEQTIASLKKIIAEKAPSKLKNSKTFTDIRFKNQIILSHRKGETP